MAATTTERPGARTRVLTVKVSDREYEALKAAAYAKAMRRAEGTVTHVSVAKFMRDAALAAAARVS